VAGRQAVLFLKKRTKKTFVHFGFVAVHNASLRERAEQFYLKQDTDTLLGLKLPGLAANQRQTDNSFFASFFSKKEDACLPAACLTFF
jgi:hypothetical protein